MRNMKIISKGILVAAALLLLIVACVRDQANFPPVLIGVIKDISIPQGQSLEIDLQYVNGFDQDGDDLSVYVHGDTNYTLLGSTVIPDSGFIGDLYIPIQLFDGIGYSDLDTMIISVVKKIVVSPVYTNSWWSYNDSVPRPAPYTDTVLQSKLEVADSTMTILIDSTTLKSVYQFSYSNLAELGVMHLEGVEEDGIYQYGLITPYDTIIKPQLHFMFPCTLGASWPFTVIKYNVTDSLLFEDTTVTITCTNTSTFITVPAGVFNCVEYTYQYTEVEDRLYKNRGINIDSERARADTSVYTEKVYYSNGVGYIKNVTLKNGVIVWNKVLVDYYVEEKKRGLE